MIYITYITENLQGSKLKMKKQRGSRRGNAESIQIVVLNYMMALRRRE